MDDLKYIHATSKRSLKDSCLFACKGDYAKAGELYDFYAKDMNLPDFDVAPQSTFSQVKVTASEVFEWLKANKDDILGVIDFVRNRGTAEIKSAKPPLPKI